MRGGQIETASVIPGEFCTVNQPAYLQVFTRIFGSGAALAQWVR